MKKIYDRKTKIDQNDLGIAHPYSAVVWSIQLGKPWLSRIVLIKKLHEPANVMFLYEEKPIHRPELIKLL